MGSQGRDCRADHELGWSSTGRAGKGGRSQHWDCRVSSRQVLRDHPICVDPSLSALCSRQSLDPRKRILFAAGAGKLQGQGRGGCSDSTVLG